MAYTFTGQALGMQPVATVSTVQNHPLGTRARAVDPTYGEAEFIYIPGCTNGALGCWVTIAPDDFATTALAADAIGPVGIMMSALDATTDFGWAMIYGKAASGLCLTGCADNALVWCTASVGRVDDTSVAGDWVNNARAASTSTTLSAEFEIYYPFVNNNSNSG